jgi:hypothetical protein
VPTTGPYAAAAWFVPSFGIALAGLIGSFNSGGGGGMNEPESQPAKTRAAVSTAASAAVPFMILNPGPNGVALVFKNMVLRLFRRGR